MKAKNSQTVGLLGLQGAFRDHIPHLEALGAAWRLVRDDKDLSAVDRLIVPGGESTVMARYLKRFSLLEPVKARIAEGMPVWGICAGSILLAETVDGGPGALGALAVGVRRNAYGRQVDSFQAPIDVPALSLSAFPAVFIRAPKIVHVGDGVAILARMGRDPVLVSSGCVLAATFHPELTGAHDFHHLFLEMSDGQG
jgi:5'-phosphate synthase pdxT subunit